MAQLSENYVLTGTFKLYGFHLHVAFFQVSAQTLHNILIWAWTTAPSRKILDDFSKSFFRKSFMSSSCPLGQEDNIKLFLKKWEAWVTISEC